jgi:hypothetical protein
MGGFWVIWWHTFFAHIFEVWGLADLLGGILCGGIIWFIEWLSHKFPILGGKMTIPRKRWILVGFASGVLLVHLIVVIPYNIYKTSQAQIETLQADNRTATQLIDQLEFDRELAQNQLEQKTSASTTPTVSPLTIQANGAMTIDKTVNPAYNPSLPPNYRFVFQNLPGIGVSQELFSENSLLAINFNFYVVYPVKIDSMQLSINGQTLESSPLIINNFTPQLENLQLLLWVYFKYEGILKPGNYNARLITVAGNTTFTSNTFPITISEPKKQEQ